MGQGASGREGGGEIALRSGRTLQLRESAEGDALEVRSAGGELEIRIVLTPDGPMVSLKGAKLVLESSDEVAVRCKRFAVAAEEVALESQGAMAVRSGGDMHLRAQGHSHIDGETLNLNCGDRSAYPPPPEDAGTVPGVSLPVLDPGAKAGSSAAGPQSGASSEAGPGTSPGALPGASHGCGCEH